MHPGVNYATKLEPFLLMAKSAKGAAAAKLVQDATSAHGLFTFAELLAMPNVQELKGTDAYGQYYALLEFFAFKTYQDYLQEKDNLPSLNASQITKLRHLSIVTLASSDHILPYSRLLSALCMSSIRELEDLIIDAIYLDLLRGKLDQKAQSLEVEQTVGRDLEPGRLAGVHHALTDWLSTTSTVLETLDSTLASISSRRAAAALTLGEHDRQVGVRLRDVLERQKDGGGKRRGGGASSYAAAVSC